MFSNLKGIKCFVQSTSPNRKMSKGAEILVLRSDSGAAGAKRKADVKDVVKGPVKKAKTGDATERIAKLLAEFKANGKCDGPVAEKDLPLGGKLPEEVKGMLLASGKWLIQKAAEPDEPDFKTDMLTIFDGGKFLDDCSDWQWPDGFKEDLLKDTPKPNVGEEGWKVFAEVCDFAELCVNTKSGAVRWMKLEDCEDGPMTDGPFDNFLHLLEDYTHALIAQTEDDPIDILDFAEEHAKH